MILGNGSFRYRVVSGWPQWRPDIEAGVVSAVATDSADHVYLMIREPTPVVHVFAPDGGYVKSWGRSLLKKPHSIWIGEGDEILIADVNWNKVFQFSADGNLIEEYAFAPSGSFCKPTWAVRSRAGSLFVAGGYGQNCMHRMPHEGRPGRTWGQTGSGPGEFSTPHGVRTDSRGRVLVADRGNSRIQIFDGEGRFEAMWDFLGPANDLFVDPDDNVFVAECDRRISILSPEGEILSRVYDEEFFRDFFHGVWVDSCGSLYVSEVKALPNRIHKLERV